VKDGRQAINRIASPTTLYSGPFHPIPKVWTTMVLLLKL